ncbi:uncharacterized protein LOC121416718, partial [Lytechinus variegatus]|uniref:uncharacterized protein LOC121416718 n=1 Tax=Lytechinus variegatus TaxID=7654 RepID=UPI001BB23E44
MCIDPVCASEIQRVDSKEFIYGINLKGNDPTASRDLARFLCLLPCLTELTIKGIQTISIVSSNLKSNDPTASRDLARFLCLLLCLTELTIKGASLFLHDQFYHEIATLASTSKHDLARFLCLLPCLTDLTIKGFDTDYSQSLFLHDEFYHEIIQTIYIDLSNLKSNDPTASRDLARFLCLLPCLTKLTINGHDDYGYDLSSFFLHDQFYHEIATLASTSKIQTISIVSSNLKSNDPTASRDLARFLCLLPCLTELTIKGYDTDYG